MKLSILSTCLVVCGLAAFGQKSTYSPRILMLTPRAITYDQRFEKEIREIGRHVKEIDFAGEDVSGHPENIQTTLGSFRVYGQKAGPEGIVPLLIAERMLFTLFRGKRNFIVLIDTLAPRGTADELKEIADRYDMQHIVYFPEVRLYYEGDNGIATMQMNVYDRATNTISLEYVNTEDWNTEEYEYSERSDEKTAVALLHNVTLFARIHLLETIGTTNPEIRERIEEARIKQAEEPVFDFREEDPNEGAAYKKLANDHFKRPFDKRAVQQFFQTQQMSVPSENAFQALFNSDSTKCVVFVVEAGSAPKEDAGKSYAEKACEQYGITGKKPADSLYRGTIVRGIKSDGKWYFDELIAEPRLAKTKEEARKILFCNLYEWHFLDRQSLTPSVEFWSDEEESESWLFARVEKPFASVEPYPYEGLTAWDPSHPDRKSFAYMTYVEANHIVREMQAFEPHFCRDVLQPFYAQQQQPWPSAAPFLIYTPDRQIVLHPMLSTENGTQRLRYIVFDRSQKAVYEWVYFPKSDLPAGTDVVAHVKTALNSITAFSMDAYTIIGDKRFVSEYLLKKNENGYLYLEAIR